MGYRFRYPTTGSPIQKDNKPQYLNQFFANIAEKTCDFSKVVYPITDDNIELKFDFQPPDLDNLMYIIRELGVSTSSCVQGINMKMCKH